MPTYTCSVRPGLLNQEQKQRIATAISCLHSEATGAPAWLAQVVIDENEHRQRYLGGKPADHHIWIRGDIRAGRSKEQRQKLILSILQAVSEISGIAQSDIWIYLCNLVADDMLEYGRLLPHPGEEQAWFEALPTELKAYLKSLTQTRSE